MSYKRLFENELVYNSQYLTYFIYQDDTVEKIMTELVDVRMDEKNKDRKLSVNLVETFNTNHNFNDIETIIIDIIASNDEVKIRKIFDIELIEFNQQYGGRNNTLLDELVIMKLIFEIKNFEVLQQPGDISFASLLRERKINKIIK